MSFSPLSLSPELWYDGSNPSGTGTPSDGASIATWVDLSGNGNDGTCTNATYSASEDAIRFSSTHCEIGELFVSPNTFSMFFVYQLDSTSSNQRVLNTNRPGNAGWNWFVGFRTSGGGTYAWLASSSWVIGNATTASHAAAGTNTIANASYDPSGPTATFYADGELEATSGGSVQYPLNMHLGGWGGDPGTIVTDPMTGYICEVMMFNTLLSENNRLRLEGYFAQKWSVTLATGHPYKNATPTANVPHRRIVTG